MFNIRVLVRFPILSPADTTFDGMILRHNMEDRLFAEKLLAEMIANPPKTLNLYQPDGSVIVIPPELMKQAVPKYYIIDLGE